MSEPGEVFTNCNSKILVTILILTIVGINSWNHEFVVTESEENSLGEVEGDVVSTYFLSSFYHQNQMSTQAGPIKLQPGPVAALALCHHAANCV